MIFNNRNVNLFSHAKAVKFNVSYYTDFERQEIRKNGFLPYYLEIPTVRVIEVDILVRDNNEYDLDGKIRDIGNWLFEAGESKLICDRDQGKYYKARCTALSKPEFNGRTAKLKATFTCSDYRPYSVLDDKPIGGTGFSLDNFTFGGKHCLNDMKCLFVLEGISAIPTVSRNAYEISGRSGTIRYDDSLATLHEKKLTGSLYFLKDTGSTELMTPTEIFERQHEVASWLINSRRSALILDNDASRQYDAEVIAETDLKTDEWANGKMSVSFVLQPYSYDISQTVLTNTLSLSAGSYKDFSMYDISSIGYTTPIVLTIKNTGSSSISDLRIRYYNEDNSAKIMRFYSNGFALAAGSTLIVNSEKPDATLGGSAALKYLYSGDFPVITPKGMKKISLYSNVSTSLSVTAALNVRWL